MLTFAKAIPFTVEVEVAVPASFLVLMKWISPNKVSKFASVILERGCVVLVTSTTIVFVASSEPKTCPLLSVVCLWSVGSSEFPNPTDPSLNVEYKLMYGYAVRSAPSLLRGTLPYTLVIFKVGRDLVFNLILSLVRLALALLISRYLVSLLTI